ncbi:MAG: hypothetical protein LBN33_07030 [Desulfovibrio sp.]|jgi:hypothetical protein|nr:hypothetical protein [Desulfovibrio sp.]
MKRLNSGKRDIEMTQAHEFLEQAKGINVDSTTGLANVEEVKAFISAVRHAGVRISFLNKTKAGDATECHEFADGSSLALENTKQVAAKFSCYDASPEVMERESGKKSAYFGG